ncbi:SMI1/KNR4 family protein [Nocardiopsis sp. NPDC049922]|uniref:SMI1/KNR4 family protein n=1 Tax=Nocardiopsis sp. NPDC049922 TaxID=3155157 RepID=UPI0033FA6EC3
MSPERNIDWNSLESELGCEFPDDYKNLMNSHGGFEFSGMILVNSPEGVLSRIRELRDHFLGLGFPRISVDRKNSFPGAIPQGLDSVSIDSLIEWADTDSDMSMCWYVGDNPNNWKVVVTDYRDCYFFPWGIGKMLGFLVDARQSLPYREYFGWPDIEYRIEGFED